MKSMHDGGPLGQGIGQSSFGVSDLPGQAWQMQASSRAGDSQGKVNNCKNEAGGWDTEVHPVRTMLI